jgi:hypothetical protein
MIGKGDDLDTAIDHAPKLPVTRCAMTGFLKACRFKDVANLPKRKN